MSHLCLSFKVAKLASEVIKPLVRKMDEESHCDPSVLKALFENGVSLYPMFTLVHIPRKKMYLILGHICNWDNSTTDSLILWRNTVILLHLFSLQVTCTCKCFIWKWCKFVSCVYTSSRISENASTSHEYFPVTLCEETAAIILIYLFSMHSSWWALK